jgi:hypothetical protein
MQDAPLKKNSSSGRANNPTSPTLRQRAARDTPKSRDKSIPRKKSTIGSMYHEDMTIKYLGGLDAGKKSGSGKEFWPTGQ